MTRVFVALGMVALVTMTTRAAAAPWLTVAGDACDLGELGDRVGALLGRPHSGDGPGRVRVALTAQGGGVTAAIELDDGLGARLGQRTVTAASCGELDSR